jgi:signal-transduction protein with cAMP-binding, CBS, and nucleotidyltransferase domain
MNTADFLKQKVPIFKDFSAERLKEMVEGSRLASFEKNEAVAHHGAEAHTSVWLLSGSVSGFSAV